VGRERELSVLRDLLAPVRTGGSGSIFVHGDVGMGKSALLDQLVASATGFRVVRANGIEVEGGFPYAGLHQLLRPMLGDLEALPGPQREALQVAFGMSFGSAADPYIVGLATLGLLSAVAAKQPLLCVVDDAQWLDPESRRVLAFVARRLGADSVALVLGGRNVPDDVEGMAELRLEGLSRTEAQALLETISPGRLDAAVRERVLAEARGNPLALLELPRAITAAEAATGLVGRSPDALASRIEAGYRERMAALPPDARTSLILAAAEPVGDPAVLRRASALLGLGSDATDAAEDAGLFEVRERCSFRHPLVRSAAYGSATPAERRRAHQALADVTDPDVDPDRRAWHRAQATIGQDDDVASELEQTAERARARGGLAAAGAFLERAAMLTTDPVVRADRALVAAQSLLDAGAYEGVDRLLRLASGIDELRTARSERIRALLLLAQRAPNDAGAGVRGLLAAVKMLAPLDPVAARAAYLDAFRIAFFLNSPEVLEAVRETMVDQELEDASSPIELIMRGWHRLLAEGYPAGTDLLREAMWKLRDQPELVDSDVPLLIYSGGVARSLWDAESWAIVARRTVELTREAGALNMLLDALSSWRDVNVGLGNFAAARAAAAESDSIAAATGTTGSGTIGGGWLAALSLDEPLALAEVERFSNEEGPTPNNETARAMVLNAAGRYDEALAAAELASELHPIRAVGFGLVEAVEAAVRSGERRKAEEAFRLLVDRTQLGGTDWALGLEARSAALLSDDPETAERRYREAIERLGRARALPDLARAHLLYGEFLRREGRRVDAREQLNRALDLCTDIGMPAFAERARRELVASGAAARRRADDTRFDLTAQEAQIARLASEGLTNVEIGSQLFLSPRTIEWHLRNVFHKLGIRSRRELAGVLG
jgi:DNA-binding CsgD family transcriptional regulator